jgi:hypothetical protein
MNGKKMNSNLGKSSKGSKGTVKRSRKTKANEYNWDIMLSEMREARGSLGDIIEMIEARGDDAKAEEALGSRYITLSSNDRESHLRRKLEIDLRHAYHHMNFAWHIRRIDPQKYIHRSTRNFRGWGKFPAGLDRKKRR